MADTSHPPKPNPSADSGASAEQAKRGLLPVLGTIGNLRDTLLVGAGTIYILGYLSWSISAYSQGLGLLPALEAQYFMAGVVPAAILGMVLLLLFKLAAINAILQRLFAPEKAILNGAFRYMAFGCVVLIFLSAALAFLSEIWVLPEFLDPKRIFESPARVVFYLIYAFVLLAAPFIPRARTPGNEGEGGDDDPLTLGYPSRFIRQHMSMIQLMYLALASSVWGFLAYGIYFENLPQEFGGIGKRCAYLDIHTDHVSRETLDALAEPSEPLALAAPAPANQGAAAQPAAPAPTASAGAQPPGKDRSGAAPAGRLGKVVRSRQVDVIFKASTVIVVEAKGLRLELTPAIVRAITWCDPPARSPG